MLYIKEIPKVKFNLKLIKNYIKENQLTKTEFCKRCKIHISVLNKIFVNQTNFRYIALFKIAKELNIHIAKLFQIKLKKLSNSQLLF